MIASEKDAKVTGSSPALQDPRGKCRKYQRGRYGSLRCFREIFSMSRRLIGSGLVKGNHRSRSESETEAKLEPIRGRSGRTRTRALDSDDEFGTIKIIVTTPMFASSHHHLHSRSSPSRHHMEGKSMGSLKDEAASFYGLISPSWIESVTRRPP
ncbi:hypothetical protein PIB30_040564 [Stylosanthes scabra]|uniref:Uncharacterized protein n=1 Tax=Stylosanthes scabra TaxID=79078 RepID=A0ABU6WEQ2_9FABA|nr:hypothetical protein [Stylosanthes scabra]